MQPDCDLLPIKGTFVSQSKHLPIFLPGFIQLSHLKMVYMSIWNTERNSFSSWLINQTHFPTAAALSHTDDGVLC